METLAILIVPLRFNGSYRTYEEWKQGVDLLKKKIEELVLTVPMRNGNADELQTKIKQEMVLTVPMRNGN